MPRSEPMSLDEFRDGIPRGTTAGADVVVLPDGTIVDVQSVYVVEPGPADDVPTVTIATEPR